MVFKSFSLIMLWTEIRKKEHVQSNQSSKGLFLMTADKNDGISCSGILKRYNFNDKIAEMKITSKRSTSTSSSESQNGLKIL